MRVPPVTRGDQLPSQRQLRVAEQMRHLLAEQLLRGDLRDPRLANRNLTVAEVRVSRDLKSATVFTTELGGELTQETATALQQAASYLGGWLARQMHLKYAPRLRFVPDETFAYAARIGELLRDARLPDRAGEDDADGAA
jgi:ribosome-binding factor A